MGATSQNGYTANDESFIQTWTIPGTDRKIRLRKGAPGALLVDFAAWFHVHIEPLDTGQLDDWGFAVRPIRGQNVEYDADGNAINLSNHASGTAEDLNATKHPLGQRGTYTTAHYAAIRAKLKEYDGCIRAGLDYVNRPDEMHYEIVRSPAACQVVWNRISKPTQPPEVHPLSDLTDADAAKIGAATAKALQPVLDAVEQKYTLADNQYDSQRAAWEAVAGALADRLISEAATKGPLDAAALKDVHTSVWNYLSPLWAKK